MIGMEWFPECKDGGLDRYFYEEIQALSKLGMSGTVIVSSAESISMAGFSVQALAQKGASMAKRWVGARRLASHALQQGVEVVNSHFALYAFPWVRKIPVNVPLVVNFQGPWAEEIRTQTPGASGWIKAQAAKYIERSVYRRADRVITLSAAFADLVCRQYGVVRSRIHVIPGALDLTRYLAVPTRKEARRRLGLPEDRPIVLAVRRLAKRMGLDLLIAAMTEVKKLLPDVLLLIGGKGPERQDLESRIADRGLGDQVRLLGFVSEADLPLIYASANISIVPTLALEGFGLITVESLAAGTPVMGTPVGATPEILRPLNPDLIFASPTKEAMARGIYSALCGNICLPGREECRAYANQYAWPVVVPKILAVFQEAIEERRPHGEKRVCIGGSP